MTEPERKKQRTEEDLKAVPHKFDSYQQNESNEESHLELRRKLYGVYDSTDDLDNALHKYHLLDVGPPLAGDGDRQKGGTSDKKASPLVSSPNETTRFRASTSRVPPPTTSTGSQHSYHRDVWGNVPLKEAREPIICPSCGRLFSTMRFALHLDKCLGLGATTRTATLQNQK